MRNKKLNEVMTRNVKCIEPDQTLADAARMMKQLDVGTLPVCDHDKLAGMITDRDITIRATAEGKNPTECKVKDYMSPHVEYCFEDQTVGEAEDKMKDKKIRRMVVLTRDKRLCGMVSIGDIAQRSGADESGDVIKTVAQSPAQR